MTAWHWPVHAALSSVTLAAQAASAQVAPAIVAEPQSDTLQNGAPDDIVVTGVRQSLERAAEIKQNAVQVVDSIVAQDIGKFPDPTTAAALQRVPGVQVSVDRQNELSGVRIRGLTDTLTTVDGREVFTTNDRSFDLQDLPAEALSRVDVFKSQTADLIEGGVAGVIDLKLNKPFNFRNPTVVLSARATYGVRVEDFSPQFGALVTDRWDTGIGEIGVLINATWAQNETVRTQTNLTDRRGSFATPLSTPGFLLPNILQNIGNAGTFRRQQVNGAIQWQASPAIEVYADAFHTNFQNQVSSSEFNVQPFTTNVRVTDIAASTDCFQTRATAAGQNPTVQTNAAGVRSLQAFTTPTLCDVDRATFLNAVANQTGGSRDIDQSNTLVAGGVRFDRDRVKATVDVAYQTSDNVSEEVRTAVGQRLASITVETDVDGGASFTVPGEALLARDTLSLRNQLIQNFNRSTGDLLQARADIAYDTDGWLSKIQAGLRFADRGATFRQAQLNTPVPFGNIGTPTEATARLLSQTTLPSQFLALSNLAPRINGGAQFLSINTDYLRTDAGRDAIRAVYNLAPGDPVYDPTRQFDAVERTYAGYAQLTYSVPLFAGLIVDGVVGVRATKTERAISTFRTAAGGALTAFTAESSDTDILPNATARVQLGGGLQSRFSYSKTVRRPEFGALNPALSLQLSGNPAVQSNGNAGNPDLRPQKSDSYDASLEYYMGRGFVAVTGYYRTIVDRVITTPAAEDIAGVTYIVSRPRNVGQAALKGVEVSGQYFLDFLPGALSGFGLLGAFTFADSEIRGTDPLVGLPLQGVSKYNYTAGLLYDRSGLSGRVVYTYRSRYYTADLSGEVQLRPIDSSRIAEVYVPPLLEYVRPAGRLDFSVGYDINDQLRFDIGGTNVLRAVTKTYRGERFFNGNVFDDETTYTVGLRARF